MNIFSFTEYKTTAPIEMRNEHTIDKIVRQVEAKYPKSDGYFLDLGEDNENEQSNLSVYVYDFPNIYYKRNHLFF